MVAIRAEFYAIYFAAFGIIIGAGIVTGFAISFLGAINPVLTPFIGFGFVLVFPITAAYIQTAKTNMIYSNLELGEIFFNSNLELKKMIYLYVTNTLAILLTLGLAIPWAKIRMAKYRAETIRLYAYNFDSLSGLIGEQQSAQAEEMADILGWDIGL